MKQNIKLEYKTNFNYSETIKQDKVTYYHDIQGYDVTEYFLIIEWRKYNKTYIPLINLKYFEFYQTYD